MFVAAVHTSDGYPKDPEDFDGKTQFHGSEMKRLHVMRLLSASLVTGDCG